MKFLFLVCASADPAPIDAARTTKTAPAPAELDVEDWVGRHDQAGERLFGERLESQTAVETVRVRNGDLLITDGPYLESKEYIAGIDVIECESIEAARQIAAEHPMAHNAGIEIRPFWNGS
ncbi:MAG TPA: YciI family protein [Microlunatus sp.]